MISPKLMMIQILKSRRSAEECDDEWWIIIILWHELIEYPIQFIVEGRMMINFGYWSGLSQIPVTQRNTRYRHRLPTSINGPNLSLTEENTDDVMFITSMDVIFLELKRDMVSLHRCRYQWQSPPVDLCLCRALYLERSARTKRSCSLGWWEGKRGFSLNTFGQR